MLINRDVEQVKLQAALPACDGCYRHVAYHETVATAAHGLPWYEIALGGEPPPFPWPGPIRSTTTPMEEGNRVLLLPPLSVSVVEPTEWAADGVGSTLQSR